MDEIRSRKGLETMRLSPRARIMPSTNPIRPPTPDTQARVETIYSTASPLRKTELRSRPAKNTPTHSYKDFRDDDYLRELIEKNNELQKANENLLRDLRSLQKAKNSGISHDPSTLKTIKLQESMINDLQKENYDLKSQRVGQGVNYNYPEGKSEAERWRQACENLEFKYSEKSTEAEVLKKEIDQLRQRIKQKEYENDKNLMKASNDSQIFQLESRFKILQDEIDNLKSLLRSKDQNIQYLKEELANKANSNSLNPEFSQLINENRLLKNKLADLEATNQEEIYRLNSQLQDFKRKLQNFDQTERNTLLQELNFYRDSKSELDNNLRELYNELERLGSQLANANTEKAKLNSIVSNREEQLAMAATELERLRRQILGLESELDKEKVKVARANNNSEMRTSQFIEQNKQLKDEHAKLQWENENLRNELLNATTQAQNRMNSLEKRHLDELEDLKYQIKNLIQNAKSLEGQSWATEREIYEKTIRQLRNKIEELENNCQFYSDELQAIKNEISQIPSKQIISNTMVDNPRQRNEIINLKEEISHIKKINQDLEDKLRHQHEIIKNLELHLQEIRMMLDENKRERDRMLAEFDGMSYDSKFYNDLKEKTFVLTSELDRISRERDNYKSQAQVSSQEVISMNRTLLEKLRELDMLKNTFLDTLRNIQLVEEKLNNRY